jgi:tripartite-type tricarboxylate transporter receptor subunit TctC
MNHKLRTLILTAIGVIAFITPSQAADAPFYQGKNVTFLINFAAGGPTDIEGRIVARHLAKYIPGNPTIIVQNMPGAGGVTGINFLGEAAKRDGLTLGYFTGPYNHHMMKSSTLRTDLMQLPLSLPWEA